MRNKLSQEFGCKWVFITVCEVRQGGERSHTGELFEMNSQALPDMQKSLLNILHLRVLFSGGRRAGFIL